MKTEKPRDYIKDIRILAMSALEEYNMEYFVRKVHRIFSTTFNVPITECENLHLEDMLQHIFEHEYENMTPNKRADEAERLLQDDEEVAEEQSQRDIEDEMWHKQMEQDLQEAKEKEAEDAEKAKESPDKLPDLKDLPPDLNLKFED